MCEKQGPILLNNYNWVFCYFHLKASLPDTLVLAEANQLGIRWLMMYWVGKEEHDLSPFPVSIPRSDTLLRGGKSEGPEDFSLSLLEV